ncbi:MULTISPECIES: hypothetical protein [Bacteria]|uniref:Uncharacterized protein n=2 Tax=Bacteria TaxID=2 RepID=A0A1I4UJD6_9BURK|nr:MULTISPECIES: hypothetical protein [Bacteria]SFE68976.1 hypothetical protein SAMN05216506_113162 [Saccharopolyspora kobensis]SFM89097.1 hypothetical protein SAMN02982985_05685 [Rugamonas rubra]
MTTTNPLAASIAAWSEGRRRAEVVGELDAACARRHEALNEQIENLRGVVVSIESQIEQLRQDLAIDTHAEQVAEKGGQIVHTPGGDQFEGPSADPIGTVRVHPDDAPDDPNARRVIRLDGARFDDPDASWFELSAAENGGGDGYGSSQVASWPRQPLADVGRVMGHPAVREADAADLAELARQQGVRPVHDIGEFATITDLADTEHEQFTAAALSARGTRS